MSVSDLGEIITLREPDQPFGGVVVYGGQAGSEGKGAIVGYLARRFKWGAAASTFMPNAGHTFVDGDEKVVVTQLPVGMVSPSVKRLVIGAGSAIDLDKLEEEIQKYDADYDVASRLLIDERAVIVTDDHRAWERKNLEYISSTAKGCGAALASKASREQFVTLARDIPWLKNVATVREHTSDFLNEAINMGQGVLMEQSQGFGLGINHGYQYPYCTSRECGPDQICSDLGISGSLVSKRIAVVRTKPIRVGNTENGYSGDMGSEELDWNHVSGEAGREVQEITTVTKRVRRVFDFDREAIIRMARVTRPTNIALTFADYVDGSILGAGQGDFKEAGHALVKFSPALSRFVFRLEKDLVRSSGSAPVSFIKTGPDNSDIIDLGYRPY